MDFTRFFILSVFMAISFILPNNIFSQKISDMGMALDYCQHASLRNVEGIWEYPDDYTRVLIKKSGRGVYDYDIIVISSPDCRLTPGDVIGSLKQQADPKVYEMNLYRRKTKNILSNPSKCVATLDLKKGALFVEAQKFKFSIGSLWFLPKFWRSVRIGFKNPSNEIKKGLVRIYPEPIGREKRYL